MLSPAELASRQHQQHVLCRRGRCPQVRWRYIVPPLLSLRTSACSLLTLYVEIPAQWLGHVRWGPLVALLFGLILPQHLTKASVLPLSPRLHHATVSLHAPPPANIANIIKPLFINAKMSSRSSSTIAVSAYPSDNANNSTISHRPPPTTTRRQACPFNLSRFLAMMAMAAAAVTRPTV